MNGALVAKPLVTRQAVLSARRVQRSSPIVAAAAPVAQPKEAVAHMRWIRGSPNKIRRVLDTIRGRSYEEALMILEYMPYKSCEPILKCLLSAAANAKNNQDMKKPDLFVSTAYCDMGPVLKRYQPHAQGRGFPIAKPLAHITIKVQERSAAPSI